MKNGGKAKMLVLVMLALLGYSAAAGAAKATVNVSVSFMRVEKIKVQDESFSIGMAEDGMPFYEIRLDGAERVIVIQ